MIGMKERSVFKVYNHYVIIIIRTAMQVSVHRGRADKGLSHTNTLT